MDRFGPTGKVSKKLVHVLRWSSFPGRTVLDFGWMDRAQKKPVEFQLNRSAFAMRPRHSNITADHFTAWALFLSIDACRTLLDSGFWILDSGFWIQGLGFRSLCQWNLDSGFQLLGIPESMSCILLLDFQAKTHLYATWQKFLHLHVDTLRILQCWSYCVKINFARHQHDTHDRPQNRAGL